MTTALGVGFLDLDLGLAGSLSACVVSAITGETTGSVATWFVTTGTGFSSTTGVGTVLDTGSVFDCLSFLDVA